MKDSDRYRFEKRETSMPVPTDRSCVIVYHFCDPEDRSPARCATKVRDFLIRQGIAPDRVEWQPEGGILFESGDDFEVIKFEGTIVPVKVAS